jgi:tungstate transport system substrate-binding protein
VKDVTAALKQIADKKELFVSRGDDSGTHIRELQLWEAAGGTPAAPAYLVAGQGMGPCLTIASEKGAYVLTDRGTYLAYRGKLDLEVLVQGDTRLRNPYGAMVVNPERHAHVNAKDARALLEFLVSPAGRKAIGDFRVDGEVLFHPHGSD